MITGYECVLRATDEDGEWTKDTVKISVSLKWDRVHAPFSGRSGHALVSFDNLLWVIAGGSSDVWRSADGESWTCVTESAPFSNLYGHAALEFDGRLWVIGGKVRDLACQGSVWSTRDGKEWTCAVKDSDMLKRYYHAAVVLNDRVWISGGLGEGVEASCLDDVWWSADGSHWTKATGPAPFGQRFGHACAAFDKRIWVAGGYTEGVARSGPLRDVWYSSDGIGWTGVAQPPYLSDVSFHSALVFGGRLWILGGFGESSAEGEVFHDVYYSTDGQAWEEAAPPRAVLEKDFHSSAVFKGTIWVLTGGTSDLWKLR